mmetsp:Transcript_23555/g.76135  ORF Transcript_23555/g.76135 Transcript_23555/m.76135 type:complete len:228 (+) Transcript_23555:2551-3234(+)
MASLWPSRAALRSAASPDSDFASAPAASSVRSTAVRRSAAPAACARPVLASADRCDESICTMACLPVHSSLPTRSASPCAAKARTNGCACAAEHRPTHRSRSSRMASSLLQSHASASARPMRSSATPPFCSCVLTSSSIPSTAALEWPAATLSSEAASAPRGPTYTTISAATSSVSGCFPFFCSAVSSRSDTCGAEMVPIFSSSPSSSCRPLRAMACSALYEAIETA